MLVIKRIAINVEQRRIGDDAVMSFPALHASLSNGRQPTEQMLKCHHLRNIGLVKGRGQKLTGIRNIQRVGSERDAAELHRVKHVAKGGIEAQVGFVPDALLNDLTRMKE